MSAARFIDRRNRPGGPARDLSPIVLGGGPAHPAPACVCPALLEPARVQPCEVGMDDQGEWMLSGGKELLEGMLNVECPEAA
jgi:hypothetical protein